MKHWFNGIPFTGLPSSVEVGGVKFWFNGVPLDSVVSGAAYLFMQPDADSIDGTWTNQADGSELFSVLDETATDDADYIKSSGDPVNDICKIRLSNPTGTPGEPFIVAYRYRKAGPDQIDLTVRLLEGTTQIAAWSHTDIASTFVTGEQTLTGPQFDSIGDFTNLFIEFAANAVTFLPSDIAGLKGWYSADQGVAQSGGLVSQWDDLSGNGHHLQASGTNQPAYGATSFNSLPGIAFDGIDNYFQKTSFALGATTDFTAIMVLNITDTITYVDRFLAYVGTGQANDHSNAGSAILLMVSTGSFNVVSAFASGAQRGTGAFVQFDYHRVASRADGANHILYIDNVAGTPVVLAPSLTSPGTLLVGTGFNGSSVTNFGAATIAEILIYDSALSTGDMDAIDAYLADKWGLILPAISDPTDIAGLKGWYSADQGVTESGGLVSQWNDLSGNGHHLVQATGTNQPTYSATSFNGSDGITFDGVDNRIATATDSFALGATTAATAIMVFKINAFLSVSERYLAYKGNGQAADQNNSASALFFYASAANTVAGYHANGLKATVSASTATNYRMTSRYDSTMHHIFKDGVISAPYGAAPSFTSPGTLLVGSSGTAEHGAATIAEIIVYDRALTNIDRDRIDAYLVAKWGL